MKFDLRLLFAILAIAVPYIVPAQRVQIRQGTKLLYEVEDWGKKYKYRVTVVESSDSLQILEWKTDGTPVYKGRSINDFIDAQNADRLLIKPNLESEELLDEYSIRLHPPLWMEQDIEASEDTLSYGIDIADAMLLRRTSGGKVKEVVYNGHNTNFEFQHYSDPVLGISLGFMPYGARSWWLYSYKDENTSMQLLEVTTFIPAPAPVSPILDSIPVTDSTRQ